VTQTNSPKGVFKALGALFLVAGVVLSILSVIGTQEVTKWHIALVAVNIVSGLVIWSDDIRKVVLSIADKLPFVSYKRPEE
jgi:hypothetical protein